MAYVIESVALCEQPTMVVRDTVPADKIGEWIGSAFARIFTHLGEAGISPAGPPFARFRFHGDTIEAEVGAPVPAGTRASGGFETSSLPGGTAAATVHVGPYETLDQAYGALETWLKDHGFEQAGTFWEEYLSDPSQEPDPARQRTRVIMPYRAA
ncbi:MAG: GyrI-like domain-containing protein [Micromonosporaceae bacterium]